MALGYLERKRSTKGRRRLEEAPPPSAVAQPEHAGVNCCTKQVPGCQEIRHRLFVTQEQDVVRSFRVIPLFCLALVFSFKDEALDLKNFTQSRFMA